MQRPNASYSKTYLTPHNYRGPRLLRTIEGTRAGIQTTARAGVKSADTKNRAMATRRRDEEDDLAIFAQPLSSDEEDYNTSATSKTNRLNELRSELTAPLRPSPKRPLTTATATRSKRRKIVDEPGLDTLIAPELPAMQDPFPEWNSSGSQKRRLQRSYANRKFQKPEPLRSRAALPETKEEFVSYDDVSKHGAGPELKVDFISISALPGKRNFKNSTTLETKLDVVDLPQRVSSREQGFQLPELPDFASSAATIAETDNPSFFEDRPSDGESNGRRRSGSTSTLSSVDSMFILEHQGELLERGERLAGVECSHLRCPVCQKSVKDPVSLFVPDNLRTLPFKKQQDFCVQHQVAEAKEQWRARGYPEINWDDFEKIRVPEKLPILEQVITRKTPSFYLEQLDKKIKGAKGNRKALKLYLNQGIVDVAKQGYYGPKGARVLVGAITAELTRTLNGALKSDSTLRAAGVGGYVSAVLVPELTSLLVKEDMGLNSSKEARDVLDQSSQIGVLLNPDDDHVEREDDEESDAES